MKKTFKLKRERDCWCLAGEDFLCPHLLGLLFEIPDAVQKIELLASTKPIKHPQAVKVFFEYGWSFPIIDTHRMLATWGVYMRTDFFPLVDHLLERHGNPRSVWVLVRYEVTT